MARTVQAEPCMGTVFTIDIRDAGSWAAAMDETVALLHRIDATFSTYRDDSDISRIRREELRVSDAHPDVQVVLDRCATTQLISRGAFSAMYDGRVDPTGFVKGWAIDEAAQVLRRNGCVNFAINGGGDVLVSGEAAPGRAWGVGIVDPHDRTRIRETVSVRDLSVATSGTAERGLHILDPFTGRPATALVSATVVGPRMAEADAYATAAFVLGPEAAMTWIATVDDYEAMLIAPDRTRTASAGWDALSTRAARAAHGRSPTGVDAGRAPLCDHSP